MPYRFLEPLPDIDTACEPVGVLEIAQRLGVQDRSVHMMRRRDRLPVPDFPTVNGSRAWHWSTILWWAGETGRLRTPELRDQYRAAFGLEPPIGRSTRYIERPDPHPDLPAVPT